MAKRFTDTEIWDKEWFMKLPLKGKLLIRFLFDKCDCAGVWSANWMLASAYIGEPVSEKDLAQLAGQVEKIAPGKFFLPRFIEFQYGELSESCRPHARIFQALKKHDLYERVFIGYPKGIHTLKDKDKDKNKEEYQDKEEDEGGAGETTGQDPDEPEIIEVEVIDPTSFESVWDLYGKKGNKKTSAAKWGRIPAKAKNLALEHIPKYVASSPDIRFRKNFETYINQEVWNDEIIDNGKRTNTGATATEDEEFFRRIAGSIQRGQDCKLRERRGG